MIKQILTQLGFTSKEAEIYLTILEYGKISPGDLARVTKISRATVYDATNKLIDRGVITADLAGKVRYYTALLPQNLEHITEPDEKHLQQKKQLIKQAVDELTNYPCNTKFSLPKIQFINEQNLDRFLHNQVDTWIQSIMKTDQTHWGFQDHTFVENFQNWIDWFWQKTPRALNLKLFTNQASVEEVMKNKAYTNKRRIKYWKNNLNFTASVWVMGEYLALVVTQQRPFYLVEIHDTVLAHNMREVFRNIWDII